MSAAVVRRVMQLVALAKSEPGASNENEARNAAMLAARLIREHKLVVSYVEGASAPRPPPAPPAPRPPPPPPQPGQRARTGFPFGGVDPLWEELFRQAKVQWEENARGPQYGGPFHPGVPKGGFVDSAQYPKDEGARPTQDTPFDQERSAQDADAAAEYVNQVRYGTGPWMRTPPRHGKRRPTGAPCFITGPAPPDTVCRTCGKALEKGELVECEMVNGKVVWARHLECRAPGKAKSTEYEEGIHEGDEGPKCPGSFKRQQARTLGFCAECGRVFELGQWVDKREHSPAWTRHARCAP